jgi:hypothetical protein
MPNPKHTPKSHHVAPESKVIKKLTQTTGTPNPKNLGHPGTKRKKVTYEEYNSNMFAIIHKYNSIANALVEMLQYTASVELTNEKTKNKK